jgi:hypothetical protein
LIAARGNDGGGDGSGTGVVVLDGYPLAVWEYPNARFLCNAQLVWPTESAWPCGAWTDLNAGDLAVGSVMPPK